MIQREKRLSVYRAVVMNQYKITPKFNITGEYMKLLLDGQNTTESPKFNPHKTKTKIAYSSELRRPKHQPYKKEKYRAW